MMNTANALMAMARRGRGACEAGSEPCKADGPGSPDAQFPSCGEPRDGRDRGSAAGGQGGGAQRGFRVRGVPQAEPCQPPELEKSGALKDAWEFLFPQRRLRVLLVEHDAAARQAVGVLLQNFNYEVTGARNGLEAWNVLQSASHPFDLVLTDVAMPILSGIDLLDKIMGSEVHGNTPVIMMSSHDSIDIVLKCLQSGAKDFLVKPLRKNELKHLWQHAWRKHHKSTWAGKLNDVDGTMQSTCDTLTKSVCGGSDSLDMDPEIKTEIEGVFMQERLHGDMDTCQLALHDSFNAEGCGRQIFNEILANSQDSSMERGGKGIDLLGTISYQPRRVRNDWEDAIEEKQEITTARRTKQSNLKTFSSDISHISLLDLTLERPYPAQENNVKGDGRGGLRQSSSSAFSRYNGSAVYQQQNSTNCHSLSSQHLLCGGFNMQSSYTGEWTGTAINGLTAPAMSYDRVGFNGLSVSSSLHISCPNVFDHAGSVNSSLPITASGEDKDGKELIQEATFLGLGSPTPDGHISTGFSPQNVQTYSREHRGRSSMQTYPEYLSVPVASPWRARQHCTADPEVCRSSDHDCDQHFQHSYHDDHFQVKSSLAAAGSSNQDQESISESRIETPLCASSDNEILPSEQDSDMGNSRLTRTAMDSFKGSASVSNQNSNEDAFTHHSSTLGFVITDTPISTGSIDNWVSTEGRSALEKHDGVISADGEVKDSVLAPDQVRNTLREAALHKFRQKRKFRCFEKKVRYQSRKKLAEQRPRVKGQFVRQAAFEEASDQEWNRGAAEGLDVSSRT